MADVNVPIRFEIYKGDQPVREEILAQDVIKIGKLASSHLRLDDETVSRMHAVIETTGPNEIHVVDLGSTRGTTVNGERITKARLQSGDEVMFGDCRVVVTFMEGAGVQETPPPQAAWGGRPSGGFAPPPTAAYAPPPQQQAYAPPPEQAYQQQAYAPPPSFAGAPGRRRRGRGARRLSRHGGPDGLPRRRHRDAPPLQPRGQVDARPGNVDDVRRHSGLRRRAGDLHLRRHRRRLPRRFSTRPGRTPARNRSPSSGRSARRCSRSSSSAAWWPASCCRTWGSSGAARRPRTS